MILLSRASWCNVRPSPLVCPERVRAMRDRGDLTPAKRLEYRKVLDQIREIEQRHRGQKVNGERDLHRIAQWVVDRWEGERDLLSEVGR